MLDIEDLPVNPPVLTAYLCNETKWQSCFQVLLF